jgi:hypothetical protein
MGNTVAWPIIRLVQRLSMILTLSSCVYLIFFLLFRNHDNSMPVGSNAAALKGAVLASPIPVLDLNPNAGPASAQARDIFSLSDVGPSGAIENTPKGQLPAHLKIVGILVADPSQIIIEDTFAKKTYFIDEYHPQDGIKIVQVKANQMLINYQGQDIHVPINKN